MNTKIAIKSNTFTPFGGIFYALDEFSRLGLTSLIDSFLGLRPNTSIPSPDTSLRGIKELVEDNISFHSDKGLEYTFNKGER